MAHSSPPTGPRARGTALLVAVVLLVVALLGGAALVTGAVGGGDDDATAGGVPDRTASAPAPVAPGAGGSEGPTASATPAPTPSPSPAEPTTSPVDLAQTPRAALLSPEEASAAERPGWTVDAAYRPQAGPELDPCRDGSAPRVAQVRASAERRMSSTLEAGGGVLVQEVYAYDSAASAEAAFLEHRQRVERCPRSDSQGPNGFASSNTVQPVSADRFLVRRVPCSPQCTEVYAAYALVARAGSAVTVASYGLGADGDPAQPARALLDALAARLSSPPA